MPRNALQNNPGGLLGQTEMRPTPRNALLGAIADALQAGKGFANRAQIPAAVPLLGGQGLGDVLLGQAPQELSEWSYGNAPMRINPNAGRTASYVPEMKPGRGQGVADALMLAQVPGGKNALLAGMGAMDGGAAKAALYVGKHKLYDNVYHGTRSDFRRVDFDDAMEARQNQDLGDAFWLAANTVGSNHAAAYAAAGSGGAKKVVSPNVFLKNPMHVNAFDVAVKLADQIGEPTPKTWPEAARLLEYSSWAKGMVMSAREQGHDALIINRTGDAPIPHSQLPLESQLTDHIAVLQPNRVRNIR